MGEEFEKQLVINELINPELNDLDCISKFYGLSEEFMEKYKDKLNWKIICRSQLLSEDFIEKHLDKLDWLNIVVHQNVSQKFKDKYKQKFEEVIKYING